MEECLQHENTRMEKFLQHENTRAESYKLLSECYYLPDEKSIKRLGSLNQSIGEPCSEIADHIPEINELELLIIDYSKLFVGPYKLLAPPYGSMYLEDIRTLMSDSTMNVRNRYMEEGLDIAFKEVPDHITIELEFMYFLVFKEVEAILYSDSHSMVKYFEKQKDFLETHLGMWISDFADNIEKNAKTEFYRNVSRITKRFIIKDMAYLSENFFCIQKGRYSANSVIANERK